MNTNSNRYKYIFRAVSIPAKKTTPFIFHFSDQVDSGAEQSNGAYERPRTSGNHHQKHAERRSFCTAVSVWDYPIEIDSSKSVEEKIPHMVEWWTRAHDLLIQQQIKKVQLAQAVKDSDVMLRVLHVHLRVEERSEAYVSSYDIVLEEDETLDVPNAILNYITAGEGTSPGQ
ncbi:hypothetical protein KOW79_011657 [Hemibagrus wyckioides]|uniref:5'-nucleotidase n=1 Tax=Hemibagrus wyckioides TaxID=337641 RepID=A0A9D3SI64_9TELE|nr:hypothetical protein KOW79_011657 [Hemibagrus wyckioides]